MLTEASVRAGGTGGGGTPSAALGSVLHRAAVMKRRMDGFAIFQLPGDKVSVGVKPSGLPFTSSMLVRVLLSFHACVGLPGLALNYMVAIVPFSCAATRQPPRFNPASVNQACNG